MVVSAMGSPRKLGCPRAPTCRTRPSHHTLQEALQFLKDALELFAMRQGAKKSKDVVQGNQSKLLEQAYLRFDPQNTGKVTFRAFEAFVNENELDEALALLTGNTGPRDVAQLDDSKLVDPSKISGKKKFEAGKIEYRNYDQGEE